MVVHGLEEELGGREVLGLGQVDQPLAPPVDRLDPEPSLAGLRDDLERILGEEDGGHVARAVVPGGAVGPYLEVLALGVSNQNVLPSEVDHEAAAAVGKVFGELPQPAQDEAFNEVAGEALNRVVAELRVPDPGAFQGNGNVGSTGLGGTAGRLHLGASGRRGRGPEGEDGEDGPQRCRPAEAKRSWGMDEHDCAQRLTAGCRSAGTAVSPSGSARLYSLTLP